jgi:hypothetical protein
MGGDGATWGNYSLVYADAKTGLVDYGTVHFTDTGNTFTFTAVGFTTPPFWDGAALYVVGLSQRGTGAKVFTETAPDPSKPPSLGDGSNEALFVKFAKPVTATVSVGVLASYELSQMTLAPLSGAAPIRFQTTWLPSGGAGVTWRPLPELMVGARVLLNNDLETRSSGGVDRSGRLHSYEYRGGVSVLPWKGGLIDAGFVVLDRINGLDGSRFTKGEPTAGVEQAVVSDRLWLRAGRDESTWTGGLSFRRTPLRVDLAYLRNLAEVRTQDVFGRRNDSIIGTLTLAY